MIGSCDVLTSAKICKKLKFSKTLYIIYHSKDNLILNKYFQITLTWKLPASEIWGVKHLIMTSSISRGEKFFLKNVPSCILLDRKFNFEQIWNNNYGLKMSHYRDMGRQTFKYDVINFQGKQFFVKSELLCNNNWAILFLRRLRRQSLRKKFRQK